MQIFDELLAGMKIKQYFCAVKKPRGVFMPA